MIGGVIAGFAFRAWKDHFEEGAEEEDIAFSRRQSEVQSRRESRVNS